MITEFTIEDPTKTPVDWWSQIEAFQGKKTFEFQKKGLTILWGPNGSGKSSLLKILARATHCEQGGSPMVSDTSIRFLNDYGDWKDGVSLKTDGKPVHFFDPAAEAGLEGGGAAFDWDFGADGIQAMFARRNSSGQQTTIKFNRILESSATLKEVPSRLRGGLEGIVQGKAPEVTPEPESDYGKRVARATRFLKANIDEDGPPTILLDEPGRSLSIPRQAELWNILIQQQRFQIIVATHSVFALWAMGAQYIDVQPGYLEESRKEFKIMAKMADVMEKFKEKEAQGE